MEWAFGVVFALGAAAAWAARLPPRRLAADLAGAAVGLALVVPAAEVLFQAAAAARLLPWAERLVPPEAGWALLLTSPTYFAPCGIVTAERAQRRPVHWTAAAASAVAVFAALAAIAFALRLSPGPRPLPGRAALVAAFESFAPAAVAGYAWAARRAERRAGLDPAR